MEKGSESVAEGKRRDNCFGKTRKKKKEKQGVRALRLLEEWGKK